MAHSKIPYVYVHIFHHTTSKHGEAPGPSSTWIYLDLPGYTWTRIYLDIPGLGHTHTYTDLPPTTGFCSFLHTNYVIVCKTM